MSNYNSRIKNAMRQIKVAIATLSDRCTNVTKAKFHCVPPSLACFRA